MYSLNTDSHNISYYFKCMFNGNLASNLTQKAKVSIDSIKKRRKMFSQMYRSFGQGFKQTVKNDDSLGQYWQQTLNGQSYQEQGIYGFYDLYKDTFINIIVEIKEFLIIKWKDYMLNSFINQIIQISKFQKFLNSTSTGVKQTKNDRTIGTNKNLSSYESDTQQHQNNSEDLKSLKYKSILSPSKINKRLEYVDKVQGLYSYIFPNWLRYIPQNRMKLVFLEQIMDGFYSKVLQKSKNQYSKLQQLLITFLSGYITVLLYVIALNPTETIVSKYNSFQIQFNQVQTQLSFAQTQGTLGENAAKIYKAIGSRGISSNLPTRIFMNCHYHLFLIIDV